MEDSIYRWTQRVYRKYTYTFGTSMHEVIQTFLHVMYTETAKKAESLDLDDLLRIRMKKNFESALKQNGGEMFCTEKEMVEFYVHGTEILNFLKKEERTILQ